MCLLSDEISYFNNTHQRVSASGIQKSTSLVLCHRLVDLPGGERPQLPTLQALQQVSCHLVCIVHDRGRIFPDSYTERKRNSKQPATVGVLLPLNTRENNAMGRVATQQVPH